MEIVQTDKPFVLSIAGLDPSGGAGLLADIKTFEYNNAYGLGVCTAITVQTGTQFHSVEWIPLYQVMAQVKPLLQTYPVAWCKIGIVQDIYTLSSLVHQLKQLQPGIRIILDPVLKATAGFNFHGIVHREAWKQLFDAIHLLTPNYEEAKQLTGYDTGEAAAEVIATCCHVLLKGGHHPLQAGVDTLYLPSPQKIFPGTTAITAKHGSGCVLSAAITANLAQGQSLLTACINAKVYTENFLSSNTSPLGFHTALNNAVT
ncbi:hydroxymethylpyrimidine/phosphomethylpyrimidine kinase [Chitinophaga jiangningensis]|uniref:hydroxymethylpyrimidine kinase n=1 Tax=Chitinophaga jiangningensis TaxID=1419482 RepID=A0A1M7EA52_9BACT|nr:hydroxymethylpyrimidine/phosphomethylpyrimidine kinase [Chitinophaga jiangningensis]SHL88642.1 hydroxymethylpyrimidine/phosphomethylpyrimidine kinase [Chitinophaga jiangningensis]